jgi:glycosyltransferase involved in cell wall biosynthesis
VTPVVGAAPKLSFVIPVVERHGDLAQIYAEYSDVAHEIGVTCEFVFVVDQRQSEVVPVLKELLTTARDPVEIVLLGGHFGESAALTVGLERARGEIVVTLASYFQVDPGGLPRALAMLEEGVGLVVGSRNPRTDSLFNRLQNSLFHRIVNVLTGGDFHDVSCGFKVMRRSLTEKLNIYGGLHRFLPVLVRQSGYAVRELDLPQREEDRQTRYYGLAVYFKRMLDLLTIFFLIKFTRRPLRFFGLLGAAVAALGGLITLYLGIYRLLGLGAIADRPLLLLGVLLMVLGMQTLSLGLIGEIIIFTHARSLRDYQVDKIIGCPGWDGEG